jgi:hypothetical protein
MLLDDKPRVLGRGDLRLAAWLSGFGKITLLPVWG